MESTRPLKKTILLVLVLVVIVALAYLLVPRTGGAGVYKNEALGFEFAYPREFTLSEEAAAAGSDENQQTILRLTSDEGQMTLVPSVLSTTTVEKEKAFYTEVLFKEVDQVRNSRVAFGEYEGFKSIVSFEGSNYVLYRPKNAQEYLVLRVDMIATTNKTLENLETKLLALLESVIFE